MTEPVFPVVVGSIHYEAPGTLSYVLISPDGQSLPSFSAGAHIDVHLGNGMMRSYSLSNAGEGGKAYRITVARDAATRGGSAWLHDTVRPGQRLEISAPRNNFPLCDGANSSVFIAGGIGVTPFLPMAARLNTLGKPWSLHYCVRTRDRAALLDEINALANAGKGQVIPNFDEEPGGKMLDLGILIAGLAPQDHVYCCGPMGMLDAFRNACEKAGLAEDRVHFEYFSGTHDSATDGGYELVLAKTGRTVCVQAGQTALKALLEAGVNVSFSCEDGVCGACETRVLAGTPDHRDMILSDREKRENRSMMVCCSGAKSPSLTLDL